MCYFYAYSFLTGFFITEQLLVPIMLEEQLPHLDSNQCSVNKQLLFCICRTSSWDLQGRLREWLFSEFNKQGIKITSIKMTIINSETSLKMGK